jgi:hypothetical protein
MSMEGNEMSKESSLQKHRHVLMPWTVRANQRST